MGFHDFTKLVKSAFISNQKPYIAFKEFLYSDQIENILNIKDFFQDKKSFRARSLVEEVE